MNLTTRQRFSAFLHAVFFLGSCRPFHVPHQSERPITRRPQQVSFFASTETSSNQSTEHHEWSDIHRRSFLIHLTAIAVGSVSPLAARAVDVVLPGEVQAKELKNRRIGGLASKIRAVGNVMVSL